MERSPGKVTRGLAVVLTTAMMAIAVIKAQGCQRPMDAQPSADEPLQTAAQRGVPTPTTNGTPQTTGAAVVAARPAPDAGTDREPDVGVVDVLGPREMFPATKAGPVFRPEPAQQQTDPE